MLTLDLNNNHLDLQLLYHHIVVVNMGNFNSNLVPLAGAALVAGGAYYYYSQQQANKKPKGTWDQIWSSAAKVPTGQYTTDDWQADQDSCNDKSNILWFGCRLGTTGAGLTKWTASKIAAAFNSGAKSLLEILWEEYKIPIMIGGGVVLLILLK